MHHRVAGRREFLRFLAASPLAALPQDPEAKDALSVLDFEPLAKKALPPAHWGYMSTGVDDDLTLRANRDAMSHYQIRARRLVGTDKLTLGFDFFGRTWHSPIYFSAVSAQRAFHPDGELGAARAAKAKNVVQMLSTVASSSVEDVGKALGEPPWFQMYMPVTWAETEKLVHRVEEAGCTVLAWTIDTLGGRNAETATRLGRTDTRRCLTCHPSGPDANQGTGRNRSKPNMAGLSGEINPAAADWSYLDRLKKLTKMKVLLKGIDTAEDAVLAREHGADGVVVSNHGGRATETGRGTLDILPEVVDAVGRNIPVLVDGGFRRGTDIFKALALGARAVGIGRPYVWGLAAYGQDGVERVIDILRAELTMTMKNCGVPSVSKFSRDFVLRNGARM
jgi:isopentenyl diphosphate isomerase/L-lactate dehydrogenase-like FMN-dependent dehydrogenase